MPSNPITDVWHFLTATTSDYLHQGNWRYLILALFWALLLASFVLGAIACKLCDCSPELAGGFGTTLWPTSRNLAGPHPDRLHVVPGHVVETAAPGVRRLAILHPTGVDGCGVRVSPHLHEAFRVAPHDNLWTDCLSCRAGL